MASKLDEEIKLEEKKIYLIKTYLSDAVHGAQLCLTTKDVSPDDYKESAKKIIDAIKDVIDKKQRIDLKNEIKNVEREIKELESKAHSLNKTESVNIRRAIELSKRSLQDVKALLEILENQIGLLKKFSNAMIKLSSESDLGNIQTYWKDLNLECEKEVILLKNLKANEIIEKKIEEFIAALKDELKQHTPLKFKQ